MHVCQNGQLTLPPDCFSLPGVKKPLGQYGPAGVDDTTGGAPPSSNDDDDDDIDLFGSDEEEVSLVAIQCVHAICDPCWLCDDFVSPSFD